MICKYDPSMHLECVYDHPVCNGCLDGYIKSKVNEGNVWKIGCPCSSSASKVRFDLCRSHHLPHYSPERAPSESDTISMGAP